MATKENKLSKMQLLLLTTAFFGVIIASPISAAENVVQTKTISNDAAVNGDFVQRIIHLNAINKNGQYYNAGQNSASSSSDVYRDVAQTSTMSNTGAITRDLIQCIIHINALTQNKRAAGENGIASPPSDVFRDVTQTSTMSNTGDVSGDFIQYIININGLTQNKEAVNIDSKISVNGNAPISIGPGIVDKYKLIQLDSVIIDENSPISVGPLTVDYDAYIPVDPAVIDKASSPISSVFGRVTQTGTMSNSGTITGESIRYKINIKGLTQDKTSSPVSSEFRDVTQTSTLSNTGAITGDLIQYIIHIHGLTNSVNGSVSPTINDKTNRPVSRVFRDITQTSTLSNTGAVTRDFIQYIIHINGLTTNEISRFADQFSVNGMAGDRGKVQTGTIFNQIKKIVDKIYL